MSNMLYNPRAYVPGGSTNRVAQAIQALGRKRRIRPPALRPTNMRPDLVRTTHAVDPFVTRASGTVESIFSPLFKKLGEQKALAEANARAAYATHASGLENALKASAAPIVSAFDTGIASAAAANEALANRLGNVGMAASGDLKSKLAQISADPATAAELAKFYTGAGNAGFAKDTTDLQHLIGRRSEAGSYQAKLPGIGRLAANQDLSSALSQMGAEFAGEESDLRKSAAEQTTTIYRDLLADSAQEKAQKAQAVQAAMEVAQRERASLRALRATATNAAEKRKYDQMEKELDRNLKYEIAQINAQTKLATDNPPKPPAVTGPANQQWISVNGKKVKNPNYKPATSSGNRNDTWLTAGSAKREKVIAAGWNAVISPEGGWNSDVLRKLQQFPRSPDAIINTAINSAMRARGIDPKHASAGGIRDAIRRRLSGRKYKDSEGNEYIFRYEVKGD